MTVRIFKSSDAGAPAVGRTLGSLITLLDACLVDGYGSRTPLGWTKEFSGTNKAVYRQPTGLMRYLRIDDAEADYLTAGSSNRLAFGLEATSVDVLLNRFDMGSASMVINKPDTHAQGGAWILLGDERGFFLFTKRKEWGPYVSAYMGELVTFAPDPDNDKGNVYVHCQYAQVPSPGVLGAVDYITTIPGYSGVANGDMLAGTPDGVFGGTTGFQPTKQLALPLKDIQPYPSHLFGGVPCSNLYFGLTASYTGYYELRGYLPGLHVPYPNTRHFFPPEGLVFEYDSGLYAGKVLEVIHLADTGGQPSPFLIETSDTWR